ncbi:MAG: replication-relaxation family protein [Anaerolineae bacterium]
MAKKQRKPSTRRADRDHRDPFRLQPRDVEIIRAVNDCQALTPEQILTAFFGSKSPAYKRLRGLFDHQYLRRDQIPQVDIDAPTSTTIYTILDLGAEALAANYGYTAEDMRYANKQVLDYRTLQHIRFLNDLRVAILRAVRESGDYEIVEWVDEKRFRAKPDKVYVGNNSKAKPILPDWYFALNTPLGKARFFVEADTGTEPLSQVRSQFEIYHEYIVSGRYMERYQSRSLMILVMTSSQKRLANLKESIQRAGSADVYWLTTHDQIRQEEVKANPLMVFEAPIWQTVQSDEMKVLIQPGGGG